MGRTKLKCMNFLAVTCLLSSSFAFSQSNLKHDQLVEISKAKLAELDNSHKQIWETGKFYSTRFQEIYVAPFVNPERYSVPSLGEIIAQYDIDRTPAWIDFNQAIDLTNKYLTFVSLNQRATIQIDVANGERVLYRAMAYYTIGTLFQLDRLSRSNISVRDEINSLKDLVLKSAKFYLPGGWGGGGLSSISNWDKFYLNLAYCIHRGFPVDQVSAAINDLSSIVRDKDSSQTDIRAASNLALELTMLCNSKCTSPETGGRNFNRNRDDHLKSIFYQADSILVYSYINPDSVGFYDQYLNLLKSTNDWRHEELRNKLILNDLNHSLIRMREAINNFRANPGSKWLFTKDLLEAIKDFFILVIATSIFLVPLWIIFFFLAWWLLAFQGTNRVSWKISFRSQSFSAKWHMRLRWLVFDVLNWACKLTMQVIAKPLRNYRETFLDSKCFAHKVGASFVTVAITLLVSNVAEMVSQKY